MTPPFTVENPLWSSGIIWNGGGQCALNYYIPSFRQGKKHLTLLATAFTLGLASNMKILWDWALESMMAWRYFSSSLLRLPLTPTIGWLQRVIVAWLSGWIHDNTFENKWKRNERKKGFIKPVKCFTCNGLLWDPAMYLLVPEGWILLNHDWMKERALLSLLIHSGGIPKVWTNKRWLNRFKSDF